MVEVERSSALCDELLAQEIQSIPDKMGFKIGDVADLLGVRQYVLRYWETEFDLLNPKKAKNNQRLYTKKDVENAFLIRKLLHRDRFSIEGAKSALRGLKVSVRRQRDDSLLMAKVGLILNEIQELKKLFKS